MTQKNHSMTAPPDWRGLCEELADELATSWPSTFDQPDCLIRARAALAAEPVADGPTDEELADTYWDAWHKHLDRTNSVLHSVGLRAVLARYGHQPAPPAEGEVAELVAELRMMASHAAEACQFTDAGSLSSAADLLEQRHPAPVPVNERLPGPGDCDAGRCYWGRQDSGRQQWHWTFSTIPMGDTHWLPAFVQSLPTIVLPLPQGEVE